MRRRLLRRLDARGHRRPALGRVEERQRVGSVAEHGHAERLEQLRRSPARRAATSRRTRRRAPACVRAARDRPRRRADPAKPRWTPPRPPVAMNEMPAARMTASVPPTVVAPVARCSTAAARSRGPTLRADASKRASSSSVSPTTISPSSTPIVAGTAPAARTCRSDSSADLDALARREAVRDERRLERDDRRRLAHLVGDADHAGRSISTNRLRSSPRTSRKPARR